MNKLSTPVAAKSLIEAYFRDLKTGSFNLADIKVILSDNGTAWEISPSTSAKKFTEFLAQEGILRIVELIFPYKRFVRYVKPACPYLEIAGSLLKNAYVSHFSAVHVHDLSEQMPKTIYINTEQGEKNSNRSAMKQRNIDLAFSRPWRTSNNSARLEDYFIYWLNGMYTGNLGIIRFDYLGSHPILVTDLERTLIDITVRPIYSGGVFEVLKAYRAALSRLDLDKIITYLRKLAFVYPYHQAIGFFLSRAGMSDQDTNKLREFGLNYDFYITHQIKNRTYSKEWRLYYPAGF